MRKHEGSRSKPKKPFAIAFRRLAYVQGYSPPTRLHVKRPRTPPPSLQVERTTGILPKKQPRTPCVKKLLQQAIAWQGLLNSGAVASQSELARREGIFPARVSQVMCYLPLAPEIQKYILSMPKTTQCPAVSARALRSIARI